MRINLRYGGNGPPMLLMHGNPLTHVHWHLVAPRLAKAAFRMALDHPDKVLSSRASTSFRRITPSRTPTGSGC